MDGPDAHRAGADPARLDVDESAMAGTASNDVLASAVVLHRRGSFRDAAARYAEILGRDPNHFDALHMLGVVHIQLGEFEKALEQITRALTIRQETHAHSNLAYALNALKRHDDALRQCDAALALKPDYIEALMNRGVALASLERFDEALVAFERVLALDPRSPEALSNRGFALASLNRHAEALASCDQALALAPRSAQSLNNRGLALAGLRRIESAIASYDEALAIKPDYAEAAYNRGIVLAQAGRPGEALESYDRALGLRPDYAEAHFNRAGVLRDLKRCDEALASRNRAFRLDPTLPTVIGWCLSDRMYCCDWDDFRSMCGSVVAAIDRGEIASNPFSLLPIPSTPAQQQRCARAYMRGKFPASPDSAWHGTPYVHDRIRIGYFSTDFRDHATAHLIANLIERHDRSRFEVIAFSLRPPTTDAWRVRMERGFDRFLDLWSEPDREIAASARALEIDIAVDLNGHTHGARPGIFALRAAPVQVNYLGYPGTMGVPFMDYLIADHTLIPPTHRQYYDEKIAYLPHSYQANDSTKRISESAPDRAGLGLPKDAFVFCCFNNSYKITPDLFDVWMRLLRKVEGSVLWLLESNPAAHANLGIEAERRGVARDRLFFAPRMALAEHLARYRLADLFLDTFYYNAHTTASDALWAGLPVLTCLGPAFAGRVAASLLTAIEVPELITSSPTAYELLALELANDADRLAAVRRKLAENRGKMPLFDTRRFAGYIETAYLRMVERSRAGLPREHIFVDA
jgi:predicted O-linked N-acetylglucosamine transferase (SPINDLY family)